MLKFNGVGMGIQMSIKCGIQKEGEKEKGLKVESQYHIYKGCPVGAQRTIIKSYKSPTGVTAYLNRIAQNSSECIYLYSVVKGEDPSQFLTTSHPPLSNWIPAILWLTNARPPIKAHVASTWLSAMNRSIARHELEQRLEKLQDDKGE